MPNKPHKPCNHRGCKELTRQRYCPAHAKEHMNQYNRHCRDPKANKRYGSSWKKARAAYLSGNPLCELCKARGKLTPATLVHHKRKLNDGGTNDFKNLQALYASCHSNLHASEGDYF